MKKLKKPVKKTVKDKPAKGKPAFGSPEFRAKYAGKRKKGKRGKGVSALRKEIKELRRDHASTSKLIARMAKSQGLIKPKKPLKKKRR